MCYLRDLIDTPLGLFRAQIFGVDIRLWGGVVDIGAGCARRE